MVHIIQQESFENPGLIINWLDANSIDYYISHVYKDSIKKVAKTADLVVIMGGTASVQQIDKYPYLVEVKEYLKEEYSKKTKMLGICLGAQLLAEMMGSKVYKNNCQEIGWFPIHFNNSELMDTPFNFFPDKQIVMNWHGDTFDIPYEAINIGSSKATPNQGFIYKNQICALQFHIETTSKSLKPLVDRLGGSLSPKTYVQPAEQLLAGDKYTEANNILLDKILSKFLLG